MESLQTLRQRGPASALVLFWPPQWGGWGGGDKLLFHEAAWSVVILTELNTVRKSLTGTLELNLERRIEV